MEHVSVLNCLVLHRPCRGKGHNWRKGTLSLSLSPKPIKFKPACNNANSMIHILISGKSAKAASGITQQNN